MPDARERSKAFVSHLLSLARPGREDRGALAALRSGLGAPPGGAARMHRYVVPYLGDRQSASDRWFYVVGALFAYHPQPVSGRSLGASLGELWAQEGRSDSVEARFTALLNSHADDVPNHLRQAVGLLRSKETGLDWCELLNDLMDWNHPDRLVQNRWARQFYRADRVQASDAGKPEQTGKESAG